jgi:hypothetical protein
MSSATDVPGTPGTPRTPAERAGLTLPKGTVPGWALRVVFVAVALCLALVGVPERPWTAIAAVLAGVAVAAPRWMAAWVLIGVLAFTSLVAGGGPSPRLLVLIAGLHALHLLGAWMLVVPAVSRLQPAVLLPTARRFALLQLPVQAAAVVLLLLDRSTPLPQLAMVSGAMMVALVAVLAAPLLRRPPR